jgi:hypothetical protein
MFADASPLILRFNQLVGVNRTLPIREALGMFYPAKSKLAALYKLLWRGAAVLARAQSCVAQTAPHPKAKIDACKTTPIDAQAFLVKW